MPVQSLTYDADKDLHVTLTTPEGTSSAPVLIFLHGGGFEDGSPDSAKYDELKNAAIAHGYAFASVEYRLSGVAHMPAPIDDTFAAIAYLKANAASLGLDGNNFCVSGVSAGAVLTAQVITMANERGVELRAGVDISGAYYSADLHASEEEWAHFSTEFEGNYDLLPEYHADAADPAMLMIHGARDTTNPFVNAQHLYEAYLEAGMDATLIVNPTKGHGIANATSHFGEIFDFLNSHLGPRQVNPDDDVLADTTGDDTLTGLAGDDMISTSGGFDTVFGGDGYDTLTVDYSWTSDCVLASALQVAVCPGGGGGADIARTDYAGDIEKLIVKGGSNDDVFDTANLTAVIEGGAGNDTIGTTGGTVVAAGGDGDDLFLFGASFTAADQMDGGDGADTAVLDGDYSAGVAFSTVTMRNVEQVLLATGHSYDLKLHADNVGPGQTLTVDASALAAGDMLTFNSVADTNGTYRVFGGGGNDVISTGNGADTISGMAGDDTLKGGRGQDTLDGGLGDDTLNGGAGKDKASYLAATSGVTVDLRIAGPQDTGQGWDKLQSIENLGGSAYNDVLIGDDSRNVLNGGAGGDDRLNGEGGGDSLNLAGRLTATDQIDGGTGFDKVTLNGTYTGTRAVTFGATTILNVETISLAASHDYDLTTHDATVAGGRNLTVDASELGTVWTLAFDGSAETDGTFAMIGGAGNDVLTGGAQADTFDLTLGGRDSANGGGGGDTFKVGGLFGDFDAIEGGDGHDTLTMTAPVVVVLGDGTITGVETVVLGGGGDFGLTTADATVAAGTTLTVDASALAAGENFAFDGSAETDGAFTIIGSAGSWTGGTLSDTFEITGALGTVTLRYTDVSQSTSANRDNVVNLDAARVTFDFGGAVGGFDGTMNGSVESATFDSDIGNAFSEEFTPGANHAWIVHADDGDFVGHDFLVVDANGDAHYDGGADYVIDITAFAGTLTAANFI